MQIIGLTPQNLRIFVLCMHVDFLLVRVHKTSICKSVASASRSKVPVLGNTRAYPGVKNLLEQLEILQCPALHILPGPFSNQGAEEMGRSINKNRGERQDLGWSSHLETCLFVRSCVVCQEGEPTASVVGNTDQP